MSNSLFSQHTRLSEEVFARFMSLPQGEAYQAEYICKSTGREGGIGRERARRGHARIAAEGCRARRRCLDVPGLVSHHAHHALYHTGIGGSGQDLRCKTRTLTKVTSNPDDL